MSDTQTLVKALRVLSSDIHCEDGVATACIAAAADTIEELNRQVDKNDSVKASILKMLGVPPHGSWEAVYEFVRDYRPDWMKP